LRRSWLTRRSSDRLHRHAEQRLRSEEAVLISEGLPANIHEVAP
jgi:hypothetical protein